MKKIRYFLPVVAASLFVSGCVNLDEEPMTFITPDQFFRTEADANAVCLGMYPEMFSPSDMWLQVPRGVQGIVLDGRVAIDNMLEPRANESNHMSWFWSRTYQTIQRANTAIEGLEGSELDPVKKNPYLGEAKAMRAYCYLKLVKNWGDIPIHTTTFDTKYGVQPMSEAYDLIFRDLNDALYHTVIHGSGKKGRLNRGACRMILADAAVTIAQSARSYQSGNADAAALKPYADAYGSRTDEFFELAKRHLDTLINREGFRLIDPESMRWIDMFGRSADGTDNVNKPANTETILATQTIPTEYTVSQEMVSVPGRTEYYPSDGGRGLSPTYEYVCSFDKDDIRRNEGFLWHYQELGKGIDIVRYSVIPFRKFGNEAYDGLEDLVSANPVNQAYADYPNAVGGEQWGGVDAEDMRKLLSTNPDRWAIVRRNPDIPTPPCAKFYDASCDAGYPAISVPVYRLAEAYLMYAEAEAGLNGVTQDAVDHLNAIHVRAFEKDKQAAHTYTRGSFADVGEFNKRLIDEYLWEFSFETKDANVLIRFGKFQERIAKVADTYAPVFSSNYTGPALGVEAEFQGQYATKNRKTRGLDQYWLPYPHAGEETNPGIMSLTRMNYK